MSGVLIVGEGASCSPRQLSVIRERRRPTERLIVQLDASFHKPRYALRLLDREVAVYSESGELGIPGWSSMVAEFYALATALERLLATGFGDVPLTVRLDARDVVDLVGRPRIKNGNLWQAHKAVRALLLAFRDVRLEWVPRKVNGAHRHARRRWPAPRPVVWTPE